jgi:predicted nucleic acid-binding protein
VEWIDALRGQTVGLDSAPLIYFIERDPSRATKLRPFFAAAQMQELRVVTSLVTLLEVLVHPLRRGREDLAREYRDILLRSASLSTAPLTEEIVEEAARQRAHYNVRTPDAIQLATAMRAGASWFLTNDASLPPVTGMQTADCRPITE